MEKMINLLKRIHRMTHIPVHFLDKTGESFLLSLGYSPEEDPFVTDDLLLKNIIGKYPDIDMPILDFEGDFLYGICRDSINNNIILGPVSKNFIDEGQRKHYANTHKITTDTFQVIYKTIDELCATLATISLFITGKHITELDIITNSNTFATLKMQENRYKTYDFENLEFEHTRYNFSVELNFIQQIRNGDPDNVIKRMDINQAFFDEERIGKLAKKSLKQNEYLACTVIILASRAAIEGGLDPMTSYSMSDFYLQRLEKCNEITEIYRLLKDITISYAQRVKEAKENHSQLSYVEQCKVFIANHLNLRFSIDDIANEIGVNKSYLSRLFSKSTGMGIRQYAQIQRIEAGAKMLRYTENNILTISNHLCFSTQSHFGKAFKQHFGITPQKYRDKNKLIDFHMDTIRP